MCAPGTGSASFTVGTTIRYLIVFDPPTFVLDQWTRAGRPLSPLSVLRRSKHFTASTEIQTPPSAPLDHYAPNSRRPEGPPLPACRPTPRPGVLLRYSMRCYSSVSPLGAARVEHPAFLKVTGDAHRRAEAHRPASPCPDTRATPQLPAGPGGVRAAPQPCGIRPAAHSRDASPTPTTSFLTAAALAYAPGAGITADAGTRLALQSLLTRLFTARPWRFAGPVWASDRYVWSLPPAPLQIG